MTNFESRRRFLVASVVGITGLAGCSSLSSTPVSTVVVLNQTEERFRVLLQITDPENRSAFGEPVPVIPDAMQTVEVELQPGEYQFRAVTEDSEGTTHEDTSTWSITESACSRHSAVALNPTEQGIDVRITTGTCNSS